MKWAKQLSRRMGVMRELFGFLWKQRLWWMIPMIAILLLFGLLLLFAQSSPLAPFVYTLF